jgi:hypothetical protein
MFAKGFVVFAQEAATGNWLEALGSKGQQRVANSSNCWGF